LLLLEEFCLFWKSFALIQLEAQKTQLRIRSILVAVRCLGGMSQIYKELLDMQFSVKRHMASIAMTMMSSMAIYQQIADANGRLTLTRIIDAIRTLSRQDSQLDDVGVELFATLAFMEALRVPSRKRYKDAVSKKEQICNLLGQKSSTTPTPTAQSQTCHEMFDQSLGLEEFVSATVSSAALDLDGAMNLIRKGRRHWFLERLFEPKFLRSKLLSRRRSQLEVSGWLGSTSANEFRTRLASSFNFEQSIQTLQERLTKIEKDAAEQRREVERKIDEIMTKLTPQLDALTEVMQIYMSHPNSEKNVKCGSLQKPFIFSKQSSACSPSTTEPQVDDLVAEFACDFPENITPNKTAVEYAQNRPSEQTTNPDVVASDTVGCHKYSAEQCSFEMSCSATASQGGLSKILDPDNHPSCPECVGKHQSHEHPKVADADLSQQVSEIAGNMELMTSKFDQLSAYCLTTRMLLETTHHRKGKGNTQANAHSRAHSRHSQFARATDSKVPQ